MVLIDSAFVLPDVLGGAGNDSLILSGSGNDSGRSEITYDMSNGGKDKIYFASLGISVDVSLMGYIPSEGGGIVTGNRDVEEIVEAVKNGKSMTFGDGAFSLGSARVTFADNTNSVGSTTFNLFDASGKTQAVGFTHSAGGSIDAGNSNSNYVFVGNYFGDKSGGSTITGGRGKDTLLGGNGDVLNGGKGKNLFIFDGGEETISSYSIRDTVDLGSASISDATVNGKNLTLIIDDDNALTLDDAAKKKITFGDGAHYFANHAIIDKSGKSATLFDTATEFSAADYSKVVTISGAAVSSAVYMTVNTLTEICRVPCAVSQADGSICTLTPTEMWSPAYLSITPTAISGKRLFWMP